jgi:hypothetical protein
MTKRKKSQRLQREEKRTLTSLLTEAFGEKVPGSRGIRPLSHYVADYLWQHVLNGKKNAYRNWQRFREFASTFDDAPAEVIRIIGGLSADDGDEGATDEI